MNGRLYLAYRTTGTGCRPETLMLTFQLPNDYSGALWLGVASIDILTRISGLDIYSRTFQRSISDSPDATTHSDSDIGKATYMYIDLTIQ